MTKPITAAATMILVDVALLYSIIAGPDGSDTEVQPVPVDEVPPLELKHLRIAFAPSFPVAAAMRDAVEALAQQLSPLSAVVEEATLPEVDFKQELMSAGALKRIWQFANSIFLRENRVRRETPPASHGRAR